MSWSAPIEDDRAYANAIRRKTTNPTDLTACPKCGARVGTAVKANGTKYLAEVLERRERDTSLVTFLAIKSSPHFKVCTGVLAPGAIVRGVRVRVVKGRKVPVGTEGVVFWLRLLPGNDRVGFKDSAGAAHFTALDHVVAIGSNPEPEDPARKQEEVGTMGKETARKPRAKKAEAPRLSEQVAAATNGGRYLPETKDLASRPARARCECGHIAINHDANGCVEPGCGTGRPRCKGFVEEKVAAPAPAPAPEPAWLAADKAQRALPVKAREPKAGQTVIESDEHGPVVVTKAPDPAKLQPGQVFRGVGKDLWRVEKVRESGADVVCVFGSAMGNREVQSVSSAGKQFVPESTLAALTADRTERVVKTVTERDETRCRNCWPGEPSAIEGHDRGRDPNCPDHLISAKAIATAKTGRFPLPPRKPRSTEERTTSAIPRGGDTEEDMSTKAKASKKAPKAKASKKAPAKGKATKAGAKTTRKPRAAAVSAEDCAKVVDMRDRLGMTWAAIEVAMGWPDVAPGHGRGFKATRIYIKTTGHKPEPMRGSREASAAPKPKGKARKSGAKK